MGDVTVLLATTNRAKAAKLRSLFDALHVSFREPAGIQAPSVREDGPTHLANAVIKAVAWSRTAGGIAIASDGGLVVPALGDKWSSLTTKRATGEDLSDADRAGVLLKLMKHHTGDSRQVMWVEAIAIAMDGGVLGAWEAEGLHGLIADSYESSVHVPPGFWVSGLWVHPVNHTRYWALSDLDRAALKDPWEQLKPMVRSQVEALIAYNAKLREGQIQEGSLSHAPYFADPA